MNKMEAEILYPGIAYFKLAKDLPGAKIGDLVNIRDADGDEYLWINGMKFNIHYAKNCPDWFIPVTKEEHQEIFMINTIGFLMKTKKISKEEAGILYEKIMNEIAL